MQFVSGVKTIRNKEDHTLNQKLDDYLNVTGLIIGIGAIVKIASFWRQKKEMELMPFVICWEWNDVRVRSSIAYLFFLSQW